ncbi:MAG: TIGR04282 family arsenosugar biosynthesis glycosyltransferase [Bryobacteraceae bacterium]|nr:TIGR04282 family arsenosugar biosynthesis glycosyltransferase [Bryobacteraceae bacterium]
MRPAIIVFAKAPIPGRVKTRLAPRLSPMQACGLHDAMVRDTLAMALGLAALADVQLHTDIPTDAWSGFEVPAFCQAEGDLGRKMLHAIAQALSGGHPRAVIVGSDAPGLPASHVVGLLDRDADVALGPCDDGGYYAICCRRAHPAMFDGVGWSGPDALAGTRRAAEACGLTVALGEPWYDIDAPADLDRLVREPNAGPHVREWLRRNRPVEWKYEGASVQRQGWSR